MLSEVHSFKEPIDSKKVEIDLNISFSIERGHLRE
jgi:hypothetical protein